MTFLSSGKLLKVILSIEYASCRAIVTEILLVCIWTFNQFFWILQSYKFQQFKTQIFWNSVFQVLLGYLNTNKLNVYITLEFFTFYFYLQHMKIKWQLYFRYNKDILNKHSEYCRFTQTVNNFNAVLTV